MDKSVLIVSVSSCILLLILVVTIYYFVINTPLPVVTDAIKYDKIIVVPAPPAPLPGNTLAPAVTGETSANSTATSANSATTSANSTTTSANSTTPIAPAINRVNDSLGHEQAIGGDEEIRKLTSENGIFSLFFDSDNYLKIRNNDTGEKIWKARATSNYLKSQSDGKLAMYGLDSGSNGTVLGYSFKGSGVAQLKNDGRLIFRGTNSSGVSSAIIFDSDIDN